MRRMRGMYVLCFIFIFSSKKEPIYSILSFWSHVTNPFLFSSGGIQIHARLGEVQYMSAKATSSNNSNNEKNSDAASLTTISDAMRRFARSVELCDDYLRGFYGLKIVSSAPKSILFFYILFFKRKT